MNFKNPDELVQFHDDWCQAASMTRRQLAQSVGTGQCMYIGCHWLQHMSIGGNRDGTAIGRLLTDMDPDSSRLRITVNRVTKYVIQEASATFPESLSCSVHQRGMDASMEGEVKAQTVEAFADVMVNYADLVSAAREANFMRCIAGLWGIGLFIEDGVRTVDGKEIPDRCVKAFDFDPVRLVLDPANKARHLHQHETVVFEDVWTAAKIQRVFGVTLEEDKLKTVGQLASDEMAFNVLSQNQLYVHYRTHANTKGAKVAQVHHKTADGRFGVQYSMYQDGDGKWQCTNFDDPRTRFGGNGLPLGLLHGHRRPGATFSIAAGQMTKEDQDRVNLIESLIARQLQRNGGYFWKTDRRNFRKGATDEEISAKFTNQVGGVLVFESNQEKGVQAPELQQYPPPPPFLAELSRGYQNDMREQVFRSPGHFGEAKTHIADKTQERVMEAADQVLGIRVQEDLGTYEPIIATLVGTGIASVQQEVPGTLVALSRAGFTPDDFGVLLRSDPYDPGVDIKVRASSIRYRPLSVKKAELDAALVNKAIDPLDYRMEQADLDTPLTSADRQMYAELGKSVRDLILGQPWQPMPLGQYNAMALSLLRRAMVDPKVKKDPEAQQRVLQAVVDQIQAQSMEQAMLAAGQPQPAGAGQPGEEQPGLDSAPVSSTLGEMLNSMSGTGSVAPAA